MWIHKSELVMGDFLTEQQVTDLLISESFCDMFAFFFIEHYPFELVVNNVILRVGGAISKNAHLNKFSWEPTS